MRALLRRLFSASDSVEVQVREVNRRLVGVGGGIAIVDGRNALAARRLAVGEAHKPLAPDQPRSDDRDAGKGPGSIAAQQLYQARHLAIAPRDG